MEKTIGEKQCKTSAYASCVDPMLCSVFWRYLDYARRARVTWVRSFEPIEKLSKMSTAFASWPNAPRRAQMGRRGRSANASARAA